MLLHLDTGSYHGLNPTGTLVWALLENQATFGQLLKELEGNLGSVPSDLPQQVRSFLVELERRDLVSLSDGAQP